MLAASITGKNIQINFVDVHIKQWAIDSSRLLRIWFLRKQRPNNDRYRLILSTLHWITKPAKSFDDIWRCFIDPYETWPDWKSMPIDTENYTEYRNKHCSLRT